MTQSVHHGLRHMNLRSSALLQFSNLASWSSDPCTSGETSVVLLSVFNDLYNLEQLIDYSKVLDLNTFNVLVVFV
jgi:hypothetical protein